MDVTSSRTSPGSSSLPEGRAPAAAPVASIASASAVQPAALFELLHQQRWHLCSSPVLAGTAARAADRRLQQLLL